ncbi:MULTISPECIES: NAD-dependent epimerase/dehydratase family protein [unclassified Nodularia (in: cyanobacteria)]|uniref:NAD-dependent epimerase/dehydratase family protein n=1 Tax=unclassified Nodularia (in: cyanobacteria) TaxID=2656917 RepID=UPI001882DFB6|nr:MULTISPECIES: NAD-dependent epimerase/dehydratase family protein [unclassified Nodularia (in: cyanobacteria)]MBE9199409.1 NAD-dependent epimerase/dehydratase family protein [Nodularia sp. LEGE 06071]MCC2692907.1 NAD-dependent epimerase/dehydratase family protein [Nodularia sp. LEGE 04288]
MRILITGICGFVGSTLAKALQEYFPEYQIVGIDNFSRSGSWLNKATLQQRGIEVIHSDIRHSSDVDALPSADWVIDAAANPSVLAGVDGKTSSLQLVQHNLLGTINLLEYCKRYQAGFILLSTSRVYSIPGLSKLQVAEANGAFYPVPEQIFPVGISTMGVAENYSTNPPVSLYGSTKVASEHLALEYGATFEFPVWINRCGVMAGAGQFGHPGQGIFAFWIHSFREQRSLKYIGFGGKGYQVRDCLHPQDLINLLQKQFAEPLNTNKPRVVNVSGGVKNSMSLRQLTQWCADKFGSNEVLETNIERTFDIPWMVLDASLSEKVWGWTPQIGIEKVLEEIAIFASEQPDWCRLSAT